MAKKKLTQVQLVMRHLLRYGSITQEQALRLYGIGRLAARIDDIRRENGRMTVSTHKAWHKTRQGRSGTHAKYFFAVRVYNSDYYRQYWGL